MKSGTSIRDWFLLLLLALIWGSSFILMKRGLAEYLPSQVAAIRMFAAFVCLSPFVITSVTKVRVSDWKYLASSAVFGNGIPALLFSVAQTKISSSVAGILNSLTPLFTMIIAFLFFKNKILPIHFFGILIGFAGAVIILLFRSNGSFEGNYSYSLLIVAATIGYAFSINIIKNYLKDMRPLHISGFAVSIAGIPYGIYLFSTDFITRLQSSHAAVISLGYVLILSIGGTAISLVLFNRLIKTSSVLFASSVTYMIPVVALIWGFSDSEKLGIMNLIGLCAILAGVYLVNRKPA